MAVEARMVCAKKVTHPPQGHTEHVAGREVEVQQHDVELTAYVGADDDETKKWSVWTPWGELNLQVNNPEAARYFEPGEHYRVVITKMQPQQART